MLHVFIGNDTARAKTEARERVGDAEFVFFGEGAETFDRALSYLDARGLFTSKVALLIDRPFETAEGKTLVTDYGVALQKTDVDVFVIAGPLTATDKKLFPKGAIFETFEIKEAPPAPTQPNAFAFADAFMLGDRKKAWIAYRRLIEFGSAPEELHGVMLWAVRSAFVAAKTKSATEAGLKPFVYTKSKRVAEKLGVERVEDLSRSLVSIYHQARAGQGDMMLGMEKLILEK